jgi:putative peptidoglycan lipid II flippase
MATAPVAEPPTEPTPPSSGRRIAGATGIMMAAILASRLLGLVRNAVISHILGQGYDADVYYGAFQIPDLLFFLIAGGALSSSFIPVFTEKITQEKEREAWHVFSIVATVMFVVISGFVVAGEIFAVPLTKLVNPGFSAAKVLATVPLTRIVLPAQLCFFLGGLLMGAQFSMQKFRIAALGPVIYNLGIILGGLLLAPWMGMQGLCWGALVGAIVGNFGLQLVAVRRLGMHYAPSFDYRHPDAMKVWKLMLPVVLGVALPQVSIWINRAFASKLGDGPMAALTNANQLMQVPLGLFAQAMAVAIFPTLSALAAERRYAELRSTSSRGIRNLLFLTIPSSVFMVILSVPIIQLLLQHGKFHAADTALAASALMVYGIGIFAWSMQSILSRSFYALQDTVTPVVIGTLVTLVFVPMNLLFMNTFHMGIEGLALATTIAATMHVVVMLWVLRNRLRGFELGKMLVSVGKTTLASAIAGLACWSVKVGVDHLFASPTGHVKIHAALSLLAGFGIGTVVYLGCATALKMEEMKQALAMLRRKPRKAT